MGVRGRGWLAEGYKRTKGGGWWWRRWSVSPKLPGERRASRTVATDYFQRSGLGPSRCHPPRNKMPPSLPPSSRSAGVPEHTHVRPHRRFCRARPKPKLTCRQFRTNLNKKNKTTFTPSHDNSATHTETKERLERGRKWASEQRRGTLSTVLANIYVGFTAPKKTTLLCCVHRRRRGGGGGRGGGNEGGGESSSAADTLSRSLNAHVQHLVLENVAGRKDFYIYVYKITIRG